MRGIFEEVRICADAVSRLPLPVNPGDVPVSGEIIFMSMVCLTVMMLLSFPNDLNLG